MKATRKRKTQKSLFRSLYKKLKPTGVVDPNITIKRGVGLIFENGDVEYEGMLISAGIGPEGPLCDIAYLNPPAFVNPDEVHYINPYKIKSFFLIERNYDELLTHSNRSVRAIAKEWYENSRSE